MINMHHLATSIISIFRGGGSVLKYKTYIPLIALFALFLIPTTPYPKNGILVPWYDTTLSWEISQFFKIF